MSKAAIRTLCAVFFLLLVPLGARAAKVRDLWVTQVATGANQAAPAEGRLPRDAIRWWYSRGEKAYMLFLPAGADPAKLRLWFTSSESSLLVDGKAVHSGDQVDFLRPGAQVTLLCGKDAYTVKVMQSQNVPALFITTQSGSLDNIHATKQNQEPGSMVMVNEDGSLMYDGELTQVKGRGNSTFPLNKKPYQIKLSKSTDLCGMGKSKTWLLLAEYRDNSLLRNRIVFALAQAMGLAYTSKAQFADLYINNEYYGAYLLCEKVEIGESRVDIKDLEKETEALNEKALDAYKKFGKRKTSRNTGKGYQIPNNPEDITGGYLVELEKPLFFPSETSGFTTKRGQPVIIKEPESASKEQVDYIRGFFQGFENAIFAKDGIDPVSGKHYSEFVDMDSLVAKYLIEEFTKNYDGNTSSRFFYKPADSQSLKAYAGPVWDYDITLGNYAEPRNYKFTIPENFSIKTDTTRDYYWLPALCRRADFYDAVKKTYAERFLPAIETLLGEREDDTGFLLSIDGYAAEISACADMNFVRWPIFNLPVRLVKTGADYAENIAYLKEYIQARAAFLTSEWVPTP